jgi:ABC-type branched-subunit amino acid transport system substrate-binding protein
MKKFFSISYSVFTVLSLSCSYSLYGFSTLSEAAALAHSLNEFPSHENEDNFNPRYDFYHTQRLSSERSLATQFLSLVGLRKHLWNNRTFTSLLAAVTQQRSCRKMHGDFIQKLTVQTGTKLILFSNLHGAFHSLVRDLTHLKSWGVLDDDFVIKNDQCYIIINGNSIDRSPYNLETLLLLFHLLNANPDRVIYVRGNDEFGRWVDYDLKTELKIRMPADAAQEIPLKKELDAFFATLPLALYIRYGNGSAAQFMRFAQLKDTGSPLDKNNYPAFLMQDSDGIHQIMDNGIKQQEINLLAFFKEGADDEELFYDRGLSFLIPKEGITNWDLLSCPTKAYQDAINLMSDSFVIIDTQADMNSWTLMHYSQDAHKKGPLEVKVYDMITGSKLYTTHFDFDKKSECLSTKDIFSLPTSSAKVPAYYVGATLDFSLNIQLGHESFEGFSVRINQENARGGIHKQFLKFLCLNDYYSVTQSYSNTLKMLQRGIDTHVMLFGSQAFVNMRSLLDEKKMILLFPEAGIAAAREKNLTNIVHFMAAYNDEVPILINQALDTLKLRKIAIFYQDDAYGKENLEVAERIFKQRGFTNYLAFAYRRGTTDIKVEAEKINLFSPDTLMFFSTPLPAITLINAIGLAKISTIHLMGVHVLGLPEFDNFLKSKGLEMSRTELAPNPVDDSLAIVAAYQDDMRAQGYTKFSGYSLLGYIHATLLVEVLKKISGSITKEKILAGFDDLKNFDLGGLLLNFNPEKRSLGNHVWLVNKGTWQHFDKPYVFNGHK